jgi:hypothetical protein
MRFMTGVGLFWLSMLCSARAAILHVVGDEPVPMHALKRVLESGGHQVTLLNRRNLPCRVARKNQLRF